MRINKMKHSSQVITEQQRTNIIEKKREKLFRSLALIHVSAKLQQIAYFDSVKETNFRNLKIKAKSNQIEKFSLDIIKSLGDEIKLKKEHEEHMEYEHFTELFELCTMLFFIYTDSIKNLSKVLRGEITPATEEELNQVLNA